MRLLEPILSPKSEMERRSVHVYQIKSGDIIYVGKMDALTAIADSGDRWRWMTNDEREFFFTKFGK